jgi:DNA-binding cell septation regulator SpoVG
MSINEKFSEGSTLRDPRLQTSVAVDPSKNEAQNFDESSPEPRLVVVERVNLAADLDRRVALVTITIADVRIHGIAIWRSSNGRLGVNFPSYRVGPGWEDAIELSPELRTTVEEEVLAAYREAKKKEKAALKAAEKIMAIGTDRNVRGTVRDERH